MEQKVLFWEQNKKVPLPAGEFKMRIAICDLDKGFMSYLKKTIYRYAQIHRLDVVADCFLSGESVLSDSPHYNIIFLGYELLGINGLETARQLRQNQVNSCIIFVSDNMEFIFDAFKVDAYRFLRKSVNEKDLFGVMDDYFNKIGGDYPLWIKSGEEVVCISTKDIYYLEADNKHCYIHLKDEILYCNRTMAAVYRILPKNQFAKSNRAFIVNLNHISRYNNDYIVLKNGENFHPSRKYFKTFKDQYRSFLKPYEI